MAYGRVVRNLRISQDIKPSQLSRYGLSECHSLNQRQERKAMKDSQTRSRHWNDSPVKQAGEIDSDLSGWMAMLLIVVVGAVAIIWGLAHS